jgi:hypothetical protein
MGVSLSLLAAGETSADPGADMQLDRLSSRGGVGFNAGGLALADTLPCPQCKHCVPPRPCPGPPEEFSASLLPTVTTTDVDSLVTVALFAESTATHFNGYDLTIQFDPAIVSFEMAQEGTLMANACSSGSNWFQQWSTDSTVVISHSLLCKGGTVFGPGALSLFTFRAVGEGTSLLDPTATFLDAGLFVIPCHCERPRQVFLSNASILVGSDPTDLSDPLGAARSSRLEFRPNPTRGGGEFVLALPSSAPALLEVVDVAGRRVFSREWEVAPRGDWRVPWSALDESGHPLSGGVYFVRLVGGATRETAKFVLIR